MSITNNNNNNNRRKYSSNRPSNYKNNSAGNSRGGNPAQIRKNATHNKAKYLDLAKNALLEGDKVTAENFFQHVHHYDTVLQELDGDSNDNARENTRDNTRDNNRENTRENTRDNTRDNTRENKPNTEQKSNNRRVHQNKKHEIVVDEEVNSETVEEVSLKENDTEDKKPKRQPRKKVTPKNIGRHEDISISEEEALLIMPQGIPGAVQLPKTIDKNSGDE